MSEKLTNIELAVSGTGAKVASSCKGMSIATTAFFGEVDVRHDNCRIASSGIHAKIYVSGNNCKVTACGDFAEVQVVGNNCTVALVGRISSVNAVKGTRMLIAGYTANDITTPSEFVNEVVDGEKIKENVWYCNSNGELVNF